MYSFSRIRTFHIAALLLSFSLLTTGCTTLQNWYGWVSIHKSPKGSVYLQEVADWSFEADHPATIDQETLLSAIQGVVAEDANFLAPLLAQGLSQAKPEQIIGFTVSSSAGSGAEPAAGTLYRSNGSLYLTIAPTDGRKISGFVPRVAARIERAPAYASDWTPGTLAMVINPVILAKAQTMDTPTATASPTSPAGSENPTASLTNFTSGQDVPGGNPTASQLEELRQAREANNQKDSEIGILRKELEWMKQELRERPAKSETVSKRSKAKRKSAEAYPTR